MKTLLTVVSFYCVFFSVTSMAELISAPKVAENANNQYQRQLASENPEEDVIHYQMMNRRLGLFVGMMLPQGDFLSAFDAAPAIGINYTWEAIRPFGFTLGMMHSGSSYKGNAASGKLAITELSLAAQASFPMDRFIPFVKFGGGFLFNHVSFDATRTVRAGNDSTVTSVDINVGLGCDFVVAREVGLGFEAVYHYAVPKNLETTTTNFNLGSPFVTAGMRLTF